MSDAPSLTQSQVVAGIQKPLKTLMPFWITTGGYYSADNSWLLLDMPGIKPGP